MNFKNNDLKAMAVTLLLLLVTNIYSQNVENVYFKTGNQIKFSASPLLYDNLEISNFGEQILKSKSRVSYEAIISYYHHIKKGYGFNIGCGLTLAPLNIHYKIKVPDNSIFQTDKYKYEEFDSWFNEYMQSLLVFPISFQYIFSIKSSSNYLFSTDFGTKFNLIWAYPYSIELGENAITNDTTDNIVFNCKLFDNGKRNLISFFVKFGVIKLTNRLNTLQCNFILNYSPFKLGIGKYDFPNFGYKSYGTVRQNINYIGIEFAYGLTLSKKSKKN